MKAQIRLQLSIGLAAALLLGLMAALGTWGGERVALAWGNTLYVDAAGSCGGHTPCYTTVQAAVDAATTGDVIRVAAGLYTGVSAREGVTQVVYISKTVTIQGGYTTAYTDPPDPASNPTVLNAAGQGRLIYITGDITPTLAGLRLAGGNATGLGGYFDPDTGQLYDGGGAVYAAYATPTITNCQIDSSGAQAGGGIALFQSPLRLYNSSVLTNQAGYGGGLAIGRSAAIVDGNLFAGNRAGYGGAIGAGQSAAQITNNTLRANEAISSGGGLAVIGNPPATVRGNLITANTARWGGGIVISSSTATVENNTITTNHADEVGGGVNLDHCDARLIGNRVEGNQSGYSGGGFYLVASTAALTGNLVLSNTAGESGGGLFVYYSQPLLDGNTINDNTADDAGGGLLLRSSAAQVLNNVIVGNTCTGLGGDFSGGGGVYLRGSDGAVLRGNWIAQNRASYSGGGVYVNESSATLTSNTIATNTADTQDRWTGGGGGIYVNNSNRATFSDNTIVANLGTGQYYVAGGGVSLNNSAATLTANRIVSNALNLAFNGSSYGGGVYVSGAAAAILAQNEIFSNTALTAGNDNGGGLYFGNGTAAQIVSNTIAFNQSDSSGGLYIESGANVLRENQIIGNRATFYGGGLYVNYGTNTIERNTILSNTADIVGGGLALYSAQNNWIANNVIAANVASGSNWFCYGGGSGIAINYPAPPLLHNTIVSNTGSPGVCFRGRSTEATLPMTNTIIAGHSTGVYVYDGQAILESTLWSGNTTNWSGNVTDNHPLTGDPAFVNPSAHDYHIGAGSAALDAGAVSGIADDIDGDTRPADGGYDVGADERPGVALRIAKAATPIAVNPGGVLVYTVVISSAGAANASGVVLTDTLPAETRVQSVQASQGTCTPGSGWGATVTCALGALNVGAQAVVTLTVETTTTVPTVMPARLRNVVHTRATGTLTMTAQADAWLQDCHARLNDNPTDYPIVQAAVDAATQASDVVKVAGTCVGVNMLGGLRQHVYVNKTLTIRGGYTTGDWNTSDPAAHPTVLDALGLGRVVYVGGAVSPTLESLTLQTGDATGLGGYTHPLGGWTEDAGGGVAIVGANATVTNCRIYSSTATYGGGLFASGGAAQVINNTLASNSGTSGGGLHLANDRAVVTGNLIRTNTASSGGGVYLNESAATLSGNTVTANTAQSAGGVYIDEGAPTLSHNDIVTNTGRNGAGVYAIADYAVITGNLIAYNTMSGFYDGGGLYHNNSHNTVTGNTIAYNVSNGDGGGAYLLNSEAQYTGNTFLNNSAGSDGGGAYVDGDFYGGGPVNFLGNTFVGNIASRTGGGLRVYLSTGIISGNVMMSNTAQDGGGAYLQSMIYNSVPLLVQAVGNTVMSNTATSDGGGFYLFGPRPYLRNNILRGNTANDDGGGLYVRYRSYESLINTVIVDNSAGDAGGGIYMEGVSPRLLHTTLARNASGDGQAIYLERYSGGTYYSHPVFTNTILANSNTGLYVDTDNSATLNGILWYSVTTHSAGGGVVTVTHAITGDPTFAGDGYHLLAGSPAINQGVDSGVTDDIDGQFRPMDWVYDLGADEYPGAVPVNYTLTIAKAGNGNGVVTPTVGAHVYLSGTVVVVTATAQVDSDFSGWSGACAGVSPTCTVTMNANRWVTATFTLKPTNNAPIANAGSDQTVAPGALVTLDGSASSDPDGDPLIYHWRQTGGVPVSFTPTLSRTTFVAASPGALTFTLTVTDTGGLSGSDIVVITVGPYHIYLPLVLRNQ